MKLSNLAGRLQIRPSSDCVETQLVAIICSRNTLTSNLMQIVKGSDSQNILLLALDLLQAFWKAWTGRLQI